MRNHFVVLILLLLTSLLTIDLFFHKGIFTAHDIEANVGRLGAFYLSISEGHVFPSWAGYVANGYGSPILMFSYSLPYYLQLPLIFIGFSLVDATKIYIFLTYILSSWFMYLFLRCHFTRDAAFIGSLMYTYVPYRINDIFARGSISEHTAFLLVPLVAIAIHRLVQKTSVAAVLLLALSLAGLILSHPFFIIITSFFFLVYIIALVRAKNWPQKTRVFFYLGLAGLLAVSLGAFLIFPLFLENKYLHYNINPFSSTWKDQYVSLYKLLAPNWTFIDVTGKLEYQTWQLGLLHILFVVVSVPLCFLSDQKKRAWLLVGLIPLAISLLLMNQRAYPIYERLNFLQQIQFPWRFAGLAVVSMSFLGAVVSEIVLGKLSRRSWRWGVMVVMIIIMLVLNLPYSKGHGYRDITDQYYFYELLNNTEGVATTPIWAALPESYPRARFVPQIDGGQARITNLYRNSTVHTYTVEATSPVTVVEETFYFPNWTVVANGQELPVQFQNPDYRGLITYELPAGTSHVQVRFLDTKLRTFAKTVSMVAFLATLIVLGALFLRSRTNFLPAGLSRLQASAGKNHHS